MKLPPNLLVGCTVLLECPLYVKSYYILKYFPSGNTTTGRYSQKQYPYAHMPLKAEWSL